MAFLLFGQPLLKRVHDLVPGTERLDRVHFLRGQEFLRDRLQPVRGQFLPLRPERRGDPAEHLGKDLVEPVEQPLVLHVHRAGEIVEILGRPLDDLGVQRLEQQQMLLQAGGDPGAAQFVEEVQEHRPCFYFAATTGSST